MTVCFYRAGVKCLHPKVTDGGFVLNDSKQSRWFCSVCPGNSPLRYTAPETKRDITLQLDSTNRNSKQSEIEYGVVADDVP